MKAVRILEIIIILGAGYILGKRFLKPKQNIHPESRSDRESRVGSDALDEKKVTEDSGNTARKNEINEDLAREEFIRKSASFMQLYESFYQVAAGTSVNNREVIEDWSTRIHNLNGYPNIQNKWESLFGCQDTMDTDMIKEKAQQFLEFIYSAGIRRDNNEVLMVDETTRFRYYALNGEDMTAGREMKVISPCWFHGNNIIEKGILTI